MALMGTVGGSGVPNRKRVHPVSNVPAVGATPDVAAAIVVVDVVATAVVVADVVATYAPSVVARMVCAPLPLGGSSALVS
jgi:hypothetical protein